MLGRVIGAVLVGVDACLIDVEVDLGGGLPTIAAVGLPDTEVREGIDRIRSALRHSGFKLPQQRVVVNLAPAEVRKQGTALDLPIAVALLLADGQLEGAGWSGGVIAGELSLDGSLRPVRGALSIALAARARGLRRILVPRQNAREASLVSGMAVVPLGSLSDVVAAGQGRTSPVAPPDIANLLRTEEQSGSAADLADVRGQALARRALEVAGAGGHHLLLSGPPGSGKTMLARRMPGILPPLTEAEAIEVTRVWSAAGLATGLVTRRPFRAPHHGISFAGMTGGGRRLIPGEITLASQGVLYLDELPEFRRDALEALRQPIEDGRITVVRLHARAVLPAAFNLVASMNPCRCGWYGSPDGRCECTPVELRRYRARMSGPLLDRFDLVVDVPALDLRTLAGLRPGESSEEVRTRVAQARDRQSLRFGTHGPSCNARMGPRELDRFASLDGEGRRLALEFGERIGLSARGFDRVRRVARTLADLDGEPRIGAAHVAEALQYRHPRALERG